MDFSEKVLGHYHAGKLRTHNQTPVLIVGADKFTRADLSKVECFNFVAAARLTALFKALRVPNLKHVFEKVPPGEIAVASIGTISMAVLGAAFEAKGLGGDAPLTTYVKHHLDDHLVTFDTMKHHAAAAEKNGKRHYRKKAAQ